MQSLMVLLALKEGTAEISVLMACVRYWVCLHVSFSTILCSYGKILNVFVGCVFLCVCVVWFFLKNHGRHFILLHF